MQARINEKHDVAKGTLFVTFDLLGEQVDFKPGQYFFVTLPDAGHQDDRGLRRHFSVVTSPNDKVLGLATRMRDSAFKRTLRELPIGTEVDVEQPKGDFVLPEDTSRPLVFIAGGIGITVFRSMLRYIREEALPYRVTLVYSNRDRDSTAFLDELRELEREISDFRLILTMTQDPAGTRDPEGRYPVRRGLPRRKPRPIHVSGRRPAAAGGGSAEGARSGGGAGGKRDRRELQRLLVARRSLARREVAERSDVRLGRLPAVRVRLLASSSDTEPAMITSSPCCQFTGVATLCSAVSCSESITRMTSSKLRPVVIG